MVKSQLMWHTMAYGENKQGNIAGVHKVFLMKRVLCTPNWDMVSCL